MLSKRSLFPVWSLVVTALVFTYCADSDEPTEPIDPLAGAALCLSDSSCTMGAVCDTSSAIDVTNCGNSTTLSWSAESDAAWLSFSVTSGETPAQFCIIADSNRTGSERNATVTVTADNLNDESIDVDVTQPSVEPTLCVSVTEWEAYSLGDTSEAISVTNCGDLSSFVFQVSEDEDWLELSLSSGNTPWPFTIIADTNNTGENRTGTVTVTADGVAGSPWEITVEQPPVVGVVGGYDATGWALGIYFSGDYAYVADGPDGVHIFDVSDPSNPTLAGTYNTPGYAYAVYVSGNYAYVADEDGLVILDVSDPASPDPVGGYDTPSTARDVHVSGDHAYVAIIELGLDIIDVSDPSNADWTGNCNTPGWALGVHVSGDHAYVADLARGLQVVDVSDPSNPSLVGNCSTPDVAFNLYVSGDHAYVAKEEDGLQIIDVSDPVSPTSVSSYDTPISAWAVFVSGDYACVADEGGLVIIDVSDPSHPLPAGSHDTPTHAHDVYVSGGYVYVTSPERLITIFELGL